MFSAERIPCAVTLPLTSPAQAMLATLHAVKRTIVCATFMREIDICFSVSSIVLLRPAQARVSTRPICDAVAYAGRDVTVRSFKHRLLKVKEHVKRCKDPQTSTNAEPT